MIRPSWTAGLAAGILIAAAGQPAASAGDLKASPAAILLQTPESTQQVLVSEAGPDGRTLDRTHDVTYSVSDPQIAAIDALGRVEPRGEGKAELLIRRGSAEARLPIEVQGVRQPTPISFEHQIIPILTKSSCNAGGCHGKAEGQNGFKLSVFGFDAPADYQALLMEGRGRRVFLPAPEHSLLLRKSTAEAPHGGGLKIEPGGLAYRRLLRWIREGAPYSSEGVEPAVSIEVEPNAQTLLAHGTQQLRVTAIDATGQRRCVTAEAEYSSNATTIAEVDGRGHVTATEVPGEAAILVRYMGHVAICRITQPRPGVQFARPAESNFIDHHVWNKLAVLGIPPSQPSDDGMFLRRVHLDVLGVLPTAAEARAFLADTAPDKRAKLIDRLLERPEYADYWTMRWADVLRVDKDKITPAGAVGITRWLRKQLVENRPYDQFVREIVTVQGDSTAESPAAFYKALDTPELLSRSFSQVFLGVRIECAQCHHHPFERWSQDDYFGLAGFFTGVQRKPLPTGGEGIFIAAGKDLDNPRTKLVVPARALGAKPADFTGMSDRREALAQWVSSPDNPYLAPSIVNRLWAHYFGRGLVDPLDDLRATNPATNEPLLVAAAQHMKDVKFDLKAFTRTILNSATYQLNSRISQGNADDEQNFSHYPFKAVPAEVLLDALSQATGTPEKFLGWPEGYRAVQVWDNRMHSYFFQIFGRPVRSSVCECERSNDPSISQALHLMNSPEVMDKVQSKRGLARRLADGKLPPTEIIDELFLATLSRFPSEGERALLLEAFSQPGVERRAAIEDTLWALLNTKEFVYNH